MKLLVIGSSGGIARRVIPRLVDSFPEIRIIGVDLISLNPANVHEFIKFDLNDYLNPTIAAPHDMATALLEADAVVYLSAAVHDLRHTSDDYERLNVVAPTRLLSEYARVRNTGGVFIYFSSIAVYGESFERVTENSPVQPVTPYAISKARAEVLLSAIAQDWGNVRLSIIRPGTVISRDDRGNLRKLIKVTREKRMIVSVRPGITKSFVDVEDLGRLLRSVLEDRKKKVDVWNAAGPSVDLCEIIECVSQVTQPLLRIPLPYRVLRHFSHSLANSVSVDSSKAEGEFGIRFNSFRNAFLREFGR